MATKPVAAKAPAKSPKPFVPPKKLTGAVADKIHELRQRRLDAQKVVDAIEAEEKALKAWIIDNLSKDSTGIAGKHARVTVIPKEIPQIKDWEKFYAFIKKNNRFDLMQRRPSDAAITEMWDAGKKIPGVEKFTTKTISINKV